MDRFIMEDFNTSGPGLPTQVTPVLALTGRHEHTREWGGIWTLLTIVLVLLNSGCATKSLNDTVSDLQGLDTVFDPKHPVVVEGEYALKEHESGQRIIMRFPDLLKSRKGRAEWIEIDIETYIKEGRWCGSKAGERSFEAKVTEASGPLNSGRTARLVEGRLPLEENAHEALEEALSGLDYVELEGGGWMLPLVRFYSPGRIEDYSGLRLSVDLIMSEDKPELSVSDLADGLLEYRERLEWQYGNHWEGGRAEQSLEGRHLINPNYYRWGYLVTVPVDLVLVPVYVTVGAVGLGFLSCCFDGGKPD